MELTAKKGEIEKRTDLFLSFPWGLPGLEDYTRYSLSVLEENLPFYFLRCASKPAVGLLLVNPFVFFRDYDFDIDGEAVKQLQIDDPGQVVVLSVVNTSGGLKSATVNLTAPVIINTERLLAKQVVLNDKRYSFRTPLVASTGAEKGDR